MRVIRRFAREVAERFAPDKIILFGIALHLLFQNQYE
jgi:hypothetical protein